MEKRRTVGLTQILVWYAVSCAVAVSLIITVWWLSFAVILSSGFLLPANTAEKQAQQAAAEMEQSGTFSADAVPALCGYALLDKGGTVLETSLSGKALDAAVAFSQTGVNYRRLYHTAAQVGTDICVLQYRFDMAYADPSLRFLPNFILLALLFLLALLAAAFALLTILAARRLKKGLAPLSAAAVQLADGDLNTPLTPSGISEYNRALQSMTRLQLSLKDSLKTQWAMEHSRIEQMNALAHDLRTPLTVIDGNAQLLAETVLSEEQKPSVEAILRGCASAQDYVASLRQLARSGAAACTPEKIAGEALAQALHADAQAICLSHHVLCAFSAETALQVMVLPVQDVRRAFSNLVLNAAEHSPAGSTVYCRCACRQGQLSLAVTDSGPGFSPAALQHGTEQFFTEDTSRTPGSHLGIGLAFSAGVAQACRGHLLLSNTADSHGSAVLLLSSVSA